MAEGFVLDSAADGPPAAAPTPPEGYEVAWQLPHRPGPLPEEEPLWSANSDRVDGRARSVSLLVTRQAVPRPAIGIAVAGVIEEVHLVQVRGHTAVFINSSLVWDELPGVQVSLQGATDRDTLVRIAESLAPVPPDDPRIKNNGAGSLPRALPLAAAVGVIGLIGGWIVLRRRA
jgi:hypothetical protein